MSATLAILTCSPVLAVSPAKVVVLALDKGGVAFMIPRPLHFFCGAGWRVGVDLRSRMGAKALGRWSGTPRREPRAVREIER